MITSDLLVGGPAGFPRPRQVLMGDHAVSGTGTSMTGWSVRSVSGRPPRHALRSSPRRPRAKMQESFLGIRWPTRSLIARISRTGSRAPLHFLIAWRTKLAASHPGPANWHIRSPRDALKTWTTQPLRSSSLPKLWGSRPALPRSASKPVMLEMARECVERYPRLSNPRPLTLAALTDLVTDMTTGKLPGTTSRLTAESKTLEGLVHEQN
jgi:hypothetical protein